MSTAVERVRARYVGPRGSAGARILVTWRGRRRTRPFEYAAADPFTHAAAEVVGVCEDRLRRLTGDRHDDTDNRVYEVMTEG